MAVMNRRAGAYKELFMLKFCTEASIAAEVRRLVKNSKDVKLAVAYWGDGACKRLSLATAAKLTVICNARSGSCNPKELEKLLELQGRGARIQTLDDLHAKVYLTREGAIVGSSNASANGQAEDGEAADSLREANLLIDNGEALDTLITWFDAALEASEELNAAIVDEVRAIWGDRNLDSRRKRLRRKHASLLKAAREDPTAFQNANIFIALYKERSDPEAISAVKSYKEKRRKDNEKVQDAQLKKVLGVRWWTYDGWKLPSASWLIDCYDGPRTTRINGIARTGDPTYSTVFGRSRKTAWIAFKEKTIDLNHSKFVIVREDEALIVSQVKDLWKVATRTERKDEMALIPFSRALEVLS